MIKLENINLSFNKDGEQRLDLFRNFSFEVKKGEFLNIVGSNGSGKTTLLGIICGSVRPDSGKVFFDGRDVSMLPEYKRYEKIGRVYQNPSLGTCADMTVFENMCLAGNKGQRFGLSPCRDRKKAGEYRELLSSLGLGLEDRMDVRAGLLSGGQRQALALLLTVMTPIDCLILDEHTAALDPKTSEKVMEITSELISKRKLTAISVTHNLRHATQYGTRLVMLREGHITFDASGNEKKALSASDLLNCFDA